MCGILGEIGGQQVREKFLEGLKRLEHRGPDGSGTWKDDGITLGHRRLSIIDTSSAGDQPMEALSRYVITYNGEIYNFHELRKELEQAGHRFKSQSDTEVLLHAYIEWGKACLNKLNGMWAFAIWDKSEKTLFLSRDRLGQKPLFYHHNRENGFVFASEMKGIYPFLDQVSIDQENFEYARHRQFYYESTERCLIEGIQRFPAASFGIYREGRLEIKKFWDLPYETHPSKNYNDHAEEFRSLFEDSCRLRMRSDVTIGTALSGGLDSSAVIGTMANLGDATHIQKDWQHAFVATFPDSFLDETEYAKLVVDRLGITAEFLPIDPLLDIDAVFEQTYLFEELFYAFPIPFSQLYKRIREHGVKVSIDGHGADELFAGYEFDYTYALIDAFPNMKRYKQVLQMIKQGAYEHEVMNKPLLMKFALLNKYGSLFKRFGFKPMAVNHKGLGFLNTKLMESSFISYLPTLLRNYDRYSMMNGVEIRMPFLDYRIVEFAFNIPYSSKVHNGTSKSIIRDGLKDYIPKKVRDRTFKIGFNPPMDQWMRGQLKPWINDIIHSRDFRESNVIDGQTAANEIEAVLDKEDITFDEAAAGFNQMIPFIWEQSIRKFSRARKATI